MPRLNAQQVDEIYTLLVQHAGASESDRAGFLDSHTRDRPTTEWRFQGHLGFGGKFYSDSRFRIDCYAEDYDEERRGIIDRVNQMLERFNP